MILQTAEADQNVIEILKTQEESLRKTFSHQNYVAFIQLKRGTLFDLERDVCRQSSKFFCQITFRDMRIAMEDIHLSLSVNVL